MQFRRILILMLGLALGLDLFLFSVWRTGVTSREMDNDPNASAVAAIEKQGIKLESLSTKTRRINYVAAQSDSSFSATTNKLNLDDQSIKGSALLGTVNLDKNTGNEAVPAYARALAKKLGYQENTLMTKFYKGNEPEATYVFGQMVDGLPVVAKEGQLQLSYNRSNHSFDFSQHHLTAIKTLHDSREIISEEAAIVALYRYNQLNKGEHLSSGTLAYDTEDTLNGYQIYQPAWVFLKTDKAGNKTFLKINAFMGKQTID
ncbi:two-component system regulatory protein YycI [Eupransor demetentiae]|uniref:Regulator of the WalKR two-component signal transduction system (YycI) n=1 Tax=Eupransor demetentiae TaxID=3109584 RepID=A0ABM9N6I6_9LACO|nr:YycI protein [Lactobacillaceae bacterium LMG 33000]